MPNPLKRGLRTFLQAFVGVLVAQGGFTFTQTDLAMLRAAAAAGVAALLAWLWNYLDDKDS
jgi:hypothetical protein